MCLITNSSGAQVAFHTYDPFGEEPTAFNQDAERMKFTGHERDLNSSSGAGDDLDYMHARFHSPVTGRLMSVDPIVAAYTPRIPRAWNRYTYALGNPIIFTDPTGRKVVCVPASDGDGEEQLKCVETGETNVVAPAPRGRSLSGSLSTLGNLAGWATGTLPPNILARESSSEELANTPAMENIRKTYRDAGCPTNAKGVGGDFQYTELTGTTSVTGQIVGGFVADFYAGSNGMVLVHAQNTFGLESLTRLPGTSNRGNPSIQQMIFSGKPPGYPKSILENSPLGVGPMSNVTVHYLWLEASPCNQ